MRRTAQNLFVFALVSAMPQPGPAQWIPHFGADVARNSDVSSTHPGSSHEGLQMVTCRKQAVRHQETSVANIVSSPRQTAMAGYFNDHSLTLATIADVHLQIPLPAAHENRAIVPITGMNIAPPTPPPRT